MIYLLLGAGLVGLLLALYARRDDLRLIGGVAAGGALLRALIDWGSW